MLRQVNARLYPQLRQIRQLSAAREFKYFENPEVEDGVAVITFNGPDKMNTISKGMTEDAVKIFKQLSENKEVKAVVFMTAKSDNWIAGADIDMLCNTKDKASLKDMCMQGHELFTEAKKTNTPFVAAIDGVALGGGLEWAMYCDYRICTTSKKTKMGLPEVKLGLLPGMAGTYHLPKLVGYASALDMMLTGKELKPAKAKKMGLVDLVVDPASLRQVAIAQAKQLAAGTLKPSQRKKDIMTRLLEDTPFGRNMMFKKAKETVDKQSGGHYPSPYAIINLLKDNYGKPKMEHLLAEATAFSKLAATSESDALIGIFLGMKAVKKHDFGKPVKKPETIGVLGAGLMGGGIAQISVVNGKYRTLLKDKDGPAVARGEGGIDKELQNKLKKKRITHADYCLTTSRLIPLHDGTASWKKHMSQADMVIEAVFEEIGVKHKVLKEMEEVISDDCVFATNTSAIPIRDIAKGARKPERVIGMHYFSPVPKMPLLEIIGHEGTSNETYAAAMEVGTKQGKTSIFVKDVPGFFVNRCLSPFSVEVGALVQDGCDLEAVDNAMKSFGMPVGPITLSDEVGIDVSYNVGKFMAGADLGDRMLGGNPEMMKAMVDQGFLGRKVGKGFYLYPEDAKKGAKKMLNPAVTAVLKDIITTKKDVSLEDMQWRMMSRFINEAAFCLQDGIIRSPVDGDIGSVFGIGFPPFMGGPFRLLDVQGTQQFVDRMMRYRDAMGPQFEPCQLLKDYAKEGKKFHN